MSKCLYCYKELEEGQVDFHPSCARKFFGSETAPILPYTRDNMSELAHQVIRTSASVTGVQAKMSLDVDRGKKNEPSKFTIVGLWGKYIFKPQSAKYPCLPELEDLTMKMAEIAHIRTARHTLIRLADGELGYLTLRMDRGRRGEKISMLDMCQLTNPPTCSWQKQSRNTLRLPCLMFSDFGRWSCFHGLRETPICTARTFHY